MINSVVLRNLVMESFKVEPDTQYRNVLVNVQKLAMKNKVYPTEEECRESKVDYRFYREGHLNPQDEIKIREIIWDLIAERIITVGGDSSEAWPYLTLTDFGKEVIEQKIPAYYDPEQYFADLESLVPRMDPVIKQYMAEGLRCFKQRLFFASAVMLGAAAEKAVLLLLESIENAITDTQEKKKIGKLLENPRLSTIFDTIEKILASAKAIPYSVHEGALPHLLSLFEMIRVQRNDAVHPHVGHFDKTKIFLGIQTMPAALEVLYRMIDWFSKNKI